MEINMPFTSEVTGERVKEGETILRRYRDGKKRLEEKIVGNEEWYRLRHWQQLGRSTGDPKPTSAWLLNSLMNKHADLMDNMPTPAILPRERSDEETAQVLSEIVPVILDRAGYDEVYDKCSWYKLKNGTSCYGVFWDKNADSGLGDIAVRKIDLLNLFWDCTVDDIQNSPNVFLLSAVDTEALQNAYPDVTIRRTPAEEIKQYIKDDAQDLSNKTVVVDWYYKQGGVLHLIKYTGGELLYATENDSDLAKTGLYAHGQYPFVLDVLFPLEGMATGFGFIDVMRDPQLYIDRLDQIILKNARLAGNPRWLIPNNTDINEAEFADWDKPFVHIEGKLDDDHFKQIYVNPLNGYVIEHRNTKINEMKETSANRDVSAGGTQSGVTAASAIAAMQEAGNKVSRDMLKSSYRAHKKVVELVIELIRQFYDTNRVFRVVMPNGATEYQEFNAAKSMMFEGRKPIFDIEVSPQKSNPFNRLSQNEFAKELYSAGVFRPEMADQALAMLDMMEFEGKQKVVEKVQQGKTLAMQVQQLSDICAQLVQQMGMATGQDISRQMAALQTIRNGQSGTPAAIPKSAGSTSAQAYQRAADLAQGAEQRRIEKGSPV